MGKAVVELFLDFINRKLVRAYDSSASAPKLKLFKGDVDQFKIHLLEPTGQANEPFRYPDFSVGAAKLAVGSHGLKPLYGTFKLTYDGEETGNIALAAAASTVQTELNALPAITSAGGVTVEGDAGGPWTVIFVVDGARLDFGGNPGRLAPASFVRISEVAEGDASGPSIQKVELVRNPAAVELSFETFPVAAVSVVQIQAAGANRNEIQRITFDPQPVDGVFTLAFNGYTTGFLGHDITAEDLQTTLQALGSIGSGNCLVTEVDGGYDVEFTGSMAGTSFPSPNLFTGDVSGLTVPKGIIMDLSLKTTGVVSLLNGAAVVNTLLELELTPSDEPTSPFTAFAQAIELYPDLIGESTSEPENAPDFLQKEEAAGLYQLRAEKGQNNGYAGLNASGQIPVDQLQFAGIYGGPLADYLDPGNDTLGKATLQQYLDA